MSKFVRYSSFAFVVQLGEKSRISFEEFLSRPFKAMILIMYFLSRYKLLDADYEIEYCIGTLDHEYDYCRYWDSATMY